MKREAKISIILSLSLLCVLVVVILAKLYSRKQTPTSREHERTPGEIPVDETPDEMEARARDNFKKITDKYSTVTDPEFFQIENRIFDYDSYFGKNQEDAQEYSDSRLLYGEASILKALAESNLNCDGFFLSEFDHFTVTHVEVNKYFLKLECESRGIDANKVLSVASYLRSPFFYNFYLPHRLKPDTRYFETLPATKLQSCGLTIKKCLSGLFKMSFLAAEACPEQCPLDRLLKIQSELNELVKQIFKLE